MNCTTFVGCINSTTLKLFTVTAFDGNAGTATIYVKQGITVISVGAQDTSNCYFADCPCFPTAHGATTVCPNTQVVNVKGVPTVVSTGQAYITVKTGVVIPPAGTPNPPGPGTYSVIDIATPKNLNTVQITLCLSPQVTGMCH
jgi:hypothetical protein